MEMEPLSTATLPCAPASVCRAVEAPGLCTLRRQEVGSTKDPNPGSSAGRIVGHYFLLVYKLPAGVGQGLGDSGVGTAWWER